MTTQSLQSTSSTDGSLSRAIIIAVLLLVAIPFVMMLAMGPMHAGWGVVHMDGWMWDGTGSTWAWVAMWLVLLGIFLAIGYVAYRALDTHRRATDPALEELRLAYARGELSDEEFETRRARLQQD